MFSLDRFQNESVLKTHRLMTEYLYDRLTTPYLMKNSPYLESANKLMMRVVQHGFIEYWRPNLLRMDKGMSFPVDIEKIESMATPATPLTVSRIIGSFMLYLIGILISMIVFIVELITVKYFKNR